ncbi:uncharacterized protein STEHIDRAFT_115887 [Stereum hirsutum FP-91666 SS1]|uniref:Uncharacterized protein n=1 Tax=Stereum hirsutum (strain FP-91666) TaxID=721885 RepID=R7RYG8_STEHR|nr:uncharacterized protein STEHIDRAFT_115887 [Stereum hirsutum FP-91666 SS1]EIM80451.1 hypothetical protein STEHIDRAFT_115887 [Stereum hirsutum FP-91666 SS1]
MSPSTRISAFFGTVATFLCLNKASEITDTQIIQNQAKVETQPVGIKIECPAFKVAPHIAESVVLDRGKYSIPCPLQAKLLPIKTRADKKRSKTNVFTLFDRTDNKTTRSQSTPAISVDSFTLRTAVDSVSSRGYPESINSLRTVANPVRPFVSKRQSTPFSFARAKETSLEGAKEYLEYPADILRNEYDGFDHYNAPCRGFEHAPISEGQWLCGSNIPSPDLPHTPIPPRNSYIPPPALNYGPNTYNPCLYDVGHARACADATYGHLQSTCPGLTTIAANERLLKINGSWYIVTSIPLVPGHYLYTRQTLWTPDIPAFPHGHEVKRCRTDGESFFGLSPEVMGGGQCGENDNCEFAVKRHGLWHVVTMDPTHADVNERRSGLLEMVSEWTKEETNELDKEAFEVFGGGECRAKVNEIDREAMVASKTWLRTVF